jgi:DNA invertase Pin-like site-specific DNA recombinase
MSKKPTKSEPPVSTVPIAYSYVRFSSREQSKGDSLRRQTKAAADWCEKNGARLDTSTTLHDLGVSAFHGRHRENPDQNALAAFLKLVKQERVPKGSYLIVESLDRLTREHVQPALLLVLNLLQDGVRIVQLTPVVTVYDKRSEATTIMMMIVELMRGNSESQVKSERIGAAKAQARKAARESGKTMTLQLPLWVRLTPDGKRVAIPERAKVVKEIFRLAADGYGVIAIAKKLNRDEVPAFSGAGHSGASWTRSYVDLILRDKRALGEFQPRKGRQPDGEPIKDYFPAVVTEQQFYAAKASRPVVKQLTPYRKWASRTGKHVHLFSMPLWDARAFCRGGRYVGKTMRKRKTDRASRVLVNTDEMRGAQQTTFPLVVFERAMLRHLKEIDPKEVLPGGADDGPDEVLTVAAELAGVEAELAEAKAYLSRKFNASAADAAGALEDRQRETAARLAEARARAASPAGEAWVEFKTLADVLERAADETDARTRLRAALGRVVKEIVLLVIPRPGGRDRLALVDVVFNSGAYRGYLIWYRSASNRRDARWYSESRAVGPEGGTDPVLDYEIGPQLRDKAHVDLAESFWSGGGDTDIRRLSAEFLARYAEESEPV